MFDSFKRLLLESDQGKIKLNQKASIFLFCFFLSTFFWFLSVLSKSYTTNFKFYIEYKGYSSDFILLEEPPEFIEGEVYGSGYELLGEQLSLSRSKIEVNLAQARSTTTHGRYYINTNKLRDQLREKLDRDIQLNAILKDSLIFKTEERIERDVEVLPQLRLEFEPGFAMRGAVTVRPNKIKVSGPRSVIDTLIKLRTETYETVNISDSLSIDLDIELPDVRGIQVSKESVQILIPVEKHTEKQLVLPLKVRSASNISVKTFPEKVNAVLLVPLSKYENLNAELLKAEVSYKKGMNTDKLKVELIGVPDFAKLLRIEPDRVEYIIRKQ